jgi:NTP pyrophosphatase (non-canonical NTP hydrolase)
MEQDDFLEGLRERLESFAEARGWKKYHAPKNLSMALIVEAAELVEHFQWLTTEESRRLTAEKKRAVSYELADILIYLVRMADILEIDLVEAVFTKIALNEQKYPAGIVEGT